MESLRHRQRGNLTFWQTVWTGVISGVILSVLTYFLNPTSNLAWVKAIINAVTTFGGWVWGVATYSVPVPLTLLFGAVLWAAIRRWRSATARPTAPDDGPLEPTQEAILRTLASEDGRSLDKTEFQQKTGRSFLLVSKAIDELGMRGFLEHHRGIADVEFYLSRHGRDFVIAKGWAPMEPVNHYRR